jgi:hypothetical protein
LRPVASKYVTGFPHGFCGSTISTSVIFFDFFSQVSGIALGGRTGRRGFGGRGGRLAFTAFFADGSFGGRPLFPFRSFGGRPRPPLCAGQ